MEQLKKTMETLKKNMEKLKKTMEKLKRHEPQKKIQNCKKKKYQKQFCTRYDFLYEHVHLGSILQTRSYDDNSVQANNVSA